MKLGKTLERRKNLEIQSETIKFSGFDMMGTI